MTQDQVDKLSELFEEGYMIQCTQGPYLDGFIQDIYHDEEEGMCYSSSTYTDVPLLKISTSQINVYKRIEDWQD